MEKKYYSYNQIHSLVESSSKKIQKDDIKFDFIISVSGGGSVPSRIMRSYLQIPIITISMSLYDESDKKKI